MKTRFLSRLMINTLCVSLLSLPLAAPAQPDAAADPEIAAEYQSMLKDAERARVQAEEARKEAVIAAEQARQAARQYAADAREAEKQQRDKAVDREQQARERALQQKEMERIREELSRAHRELREATREIARAHRDVARSSDLHTVVREVNLGDRAVLGVILGSESAEGVAIVGVSPDGPAERAGLEAGDVLLSIRGESLAGGGPRKEKGRATLFRVMDDTKPGESVAVTVSRGGETRNFDITAERREPSSWQTLIRIPEAPVAPPADGATVAPGAPIAADAPHVVVERIEVPRIDEEALNARIQALNDELKTHQFMFVTPDGEELEIERELVLPDGFDAEVAEYSELAGRALREANIWFGLPHSQGLELVEINEGLGTYFKTERGVLVVKARADNAYQLESGDVVLEINAKPVDSPTDLMRALREIEPGSEVRIAIKRDRRNKTLNVVMPENRLGYSWSVEPQIAPQP